MTANAPNPSEDPAGRAASIAGALTLPEGIPGPRLSKYRRDIFPSKLSLSGQDLAEFLNLIRKCNAGSIEFEVRGRNPEVNSSDEEARTEIERLMPIEYNFREPSGDSHEGLWLSQGNSAAFSDDLETFFASNSTYSKKMIDREARNTVNAFLSFERPSLKLDFGTMPSNPTPNRSVINVEGTDEAWVVLTADKVRSFLSDRSVRRPFIHESGSYDYFLYFAYFPILLWIWSRFRDSPPMIWIESQSLLFSLVVSSYVFLLSLIIARIAFQYARWLFPPMEYLGGRRARWVVQRTVFGCAIGSLALAAAYDIAKAVFRSLF